MKINKKSNIINKKGLIILATALLAIAGLICWYVISQRSAQSNREATSHIDKTSSVKQDQVPGSDNTGSTAKTSDLPQKSSENSSSTPSPGSKDSDLKLLSSIEKPAITRAEQSGEFIKIVATFTNSSSGVCKLKLESSNQTALLYESPIVLSASYYVCSFNISRSSFAVTGNWTATLYQQKDNYRSEFASENFNIN